MATLTFRADGGARVSRSMAAEIVQGSKVRGLLRPLRAAGGSSEGISRLGRSAERCQAALVPIACVPKLPAQSKIDFEAASGLGRNARGGTWPRLSLGPLGVVDLEPDLGDLAHLLEKFSRIFDEVHRLALVHARRPARDVTGDALATIEDVEPFQTRPGLSVAQRRERCSESGERDRRRNDASSSYRESLLAEWRCGVFLDGARLGGGASRAARSGN
jgi:hypothetical protein